jgi:hypothetical protein
LGGPAGRPAAWPWLDLNFEYMHGTNASYVLCEDVLTLCTDVHVIRINVHWKI